MKKTKAYITYSDNELWKNRWLIYLKNNERIVCILTKTEIKKMNKDDEEKSSALKIKYNSFSFLNDVYCFMILIWIQK